MTFQQSYETAQTISGDTSAATLVQFKQDINIGNRKFNAGLNNYFTRRSKSTNMVADQQYYQLPPDCVRVMGVDFVLTSDRRMPLNQVRSEYQWRQINFTEQSSNWITYYFVKGADEIGLYPIPSDALTNGIIIYYEPRGSNLSQADYTTGTVTVTNGSTTITHSGTGFTNSMVGRSFEVTDGSDGYTYKISGYTSSSVMTLEEPFIGLSGTLATFRIGETFMFPDEYHHAPVDYALSTFFEVNKNAALASYHMGKFTSALTEAREKYASSSSSAVITDENPYVNPWFDNTQTIAEL